MSKLYRGYVAGKRGTFQLDLDLDDGLSTGTPTEVEVGSLFVQWNRLELAFTVGLRPSFCDVEFVDPDGSIRTLLEAATGEAQYLATITGTYVNPDGVSRSFYWEGRARSLPRRRALTRSLGVATTTLRLWDRFGQYRDTEGPSRLQQVLSEMFAQAHDDVNLATLPLDIYLDAWPANIFAETPEDLRFDEELVGSEEEGFGTYLDHFEAVGDQLSMVFYQTTQGTYRAWYRGAVGQLVTVRRYEAGVGYSDVEIAENLQVLSTDELERAGVYEGIRPLHGLTLVGLALADLATDGCFTEVSSYGTGPNGSDVFTFWQAADGLGKAEQAGFGPAADCVTSLYSDTLGFDANDKAGVQQDFYVTAATAGIRVAVDLQSNQLNHLAADSGGELYLMMPNILGGPYWYTGAGWSTTRTAWQTWNNSTDILWEAFSYVQGHDFPGVGQVRLIVRTYLMYISDVVITLEDDMGAPLESEFVTLAGAEDGDLIEITRAQLMEADTDGGPTWAQPTSWFSTRHQLSFDTLADWQAYDRLTAQGEPLDVLDGLLDGLYGPEVGLVVAPEHRPGEVVKFIPEAVRLSLKDGTTEVVAPEDRTYTVSPTVLGFGAWWFNDPIHSGQVLTIGM